MAEFHQIFLDKFEGDMVVAWDTCLNVKKTGHITCEDLVTVMGEFGMAEDKVKRIFKFLDSDDTNNISLDEIDPDAATRKLHGHKFHPKTPTDSPAASSSKEETFPPDEDTK